MIDFPNCKINIGLHVTEKRADGYHNIETVFYPLPKNDVLEVITSSTNETTLNATGIKVTDNSNDNLCIKAYHLLKNDFPQLPAVNIYLHKNIPAGAGLGAGSANGAFTLLLLNKKYNLNLSEQQLIDYALELGSDCPFFIKNKPCFATGRGEILEEINVDLKGYSFLIINPRIHINTGWAFSQITPQQPKYSLKEIIQKPVEEWKRFITNEFQQAACVAHPAIQETIDKLYNANAVYAAMTGTGSTVYGIFKKEEIPSLEFDKDWMTRIVNC